MVVAQEKGEYVGFDTAEFTSRSGGKPAAIKAIKVHAEQRASHIQKTAPVTFFSSHWSLSCVF